MTGHADVALAVEAMKAGAVDFIEKPFDDEVLLCAIHAALTRQEARAEDDTPPPKREARLATCRTAKGRCWTAFCAAIPTRPSPMIWDQPPHGRGSSRQCDD